MKKENVMQSVEIHKFVRFILNNELYQDMPVSAFKVRVDSYFDYYNY